MGGSEGLVEGLKAWLEKRTAAPVEVKETHISSLLLTARLAFKLKKPVKLPFVDFSTAALRLRFLREELRLNRRLAPTLYRGLVSVRRGPDGLSFGGDGELVDHALCMRRFPEGALLSERLEAGRLQAEELDRLAHRLASFHREAPVSTPEDAYGCAQSIVRAADGVLDQLERAGEDIRDWRAWVHERSQALQPVWQQRRAQGAVRECHGDLHLANTLVLGDEVTAFDCLEFDPALRWIDTMNDIAFLTMDLRARGRVDLAWRFLDSYLQHSGDHAGLEVLRFYEVYRALVRALVERLQARADAPAQGPADYLRCATTLQEEGRLRPRLAILYGVSGSGKSTLALQLLQAAGAVRLRSDVERKRLFGLDALAKSSAAGLHIYGADATRRTYERLSEGARASLRAGYSTIVDAAFLRRDERMAFRELAHELNAPFCVIACRADEAVLRRRVAGRAAAGHDPSEADLQVLSRQLAHQQLPDAEESAVTLCVDTSTPVDLGRLVADWQQDRPARP